MPTVTSTTKATSARTQLHAFLQRREKISAATDELLSSKVPPEPKRRQQEEQIRPTPKGRGREWYTPAQYWDELPLMQTGSRNNPAKKKDIVTVNFDRSDSDTSYAGMEESRQRHVTRNKESIVAGGGGVRVTTRSTEKGREQGQFVRRVKRGSVNQTRAI